MRAGTVKIENVRADRVLSSKTQRSQLSSPEGLPQHNFGQAHVPAQRAGTSKCFCRCPHAPSTMLRMVPLPRFAEEEPHSKSGAVFVRSARNDSAVVGF